MKKLFIYTLLILTASQLKAQESVTFKMIYLPNHTYNATIDMNVGGKVTISGDEKITEKLTEQGITQPINLNLLLNMKGLTKTGAADASGNFPLTLSFNIGKIDLSVSGKQIPIPPQANVATTIYGHVGKDGKLKADSLKGSKMADTSEQKITQMMNSVQNKIKFPDHPLKVGDTFEQDIPINLPMAQNSQSSTKAVYKLVSISGGNAYFDITQTAAIQLNIKQVVLNITGSGTGKLVYNLKNSFPTDYNANLTLKLDGKFATVAINGDLTIAMEYKYDIQ